jgi:hypothetical protein
MEKFVVLMLTNAASQPQHKNLGNRGSTNSHKQWIPRTRQKTKLNTPRLLKQVPSTRERENQIHEPWLLRRWQDD